MENYVEIWNQILDELEQKYDAETFNDILKPCKPISFKNGYLNILCESSFIKTKLNRLYINNINDILARKIPNELVKVKFLLKEEIKEEVTITSPENLTNRYRNNLNANHNFNNFVVGNSNMMAFRMAMKVADQPGIVANPLYIFGNVGLGKTHLMEAIGNYILDKNINEQVLYVKANEFIEDYSKMCSGKLNSDLYEAKYRDVKILLIDDIQMLELGVKSQQEFFKIFDMLYNGNKQIVITSDRPAKELNIMPRLSSRFEVGLVVDIQAPSLEHRIDIVKRKLADLGKEDVPADVLEYVAVNFTSNIRELEGAAIKLFYYCEIFSCELNLENTKNALASLISKSSSKQNNNDDSYTNVIGIVADFYSISYEEITGTKRTSTIALARQIAMYILKNKYGLAYTKIGQLFNGKDHSTVMSSIDKIEKEIITNMQIKLAIETIEKKIAK